MKHFSSSRYVAQELRPWMTLPFATIGPLLAAELALRAIADRGFPDLLSGARVEREQVRVVRRDEHLVVVHRDAAHCGR